MLDLKALIANAASIGISGHVKPDGDCVGSVMGLYNYIKHVFPDKEVHAFIEPPASIFKFITNTDKIESEWKEDYKLDLFFALDCGDKDRMGRFVPLFEASKKKVNIDHHISNDSFADENYVLPDASSTSEMMFSLMNIEDITKEVAECLYLGIAHDTGVFQYSCTAPSTMNAAGELMKKGIDFTDILTKTYYEFTYEQNKMLATAIVNAKRYFKNKCIASTITRSEMKKYNAKYSDLEGIVSHLRATKGVDVSIFLYETAKPGELKLSLRSQSIVDCAKVSACYGGGGHVRAAGATIISDDIESALNDVIQKVGEQLS